MHSKLDLKISSWQRESLTQTQSDVRFVRPYGPSGYFNMYYVLVWLSFIVDLVCVCVFVCEFRSVFDLAQSYRVYCDSTLEQGVYSSVYSLETF